MLQTAITKTAVKGFVVEKVTAEDINSGVNKIMSTLNADTLSRFDKIFIKRALGEKVFVSQHVEVDKFAFIVSSFHIGMNNQNGDTVSQLGKIFLYTENKFLKVLAGLALRRLHYNVSLPMDTTEIKEATYKLVGLAFRVGNDIEKTYASN